MAEYAKFVLEDALRRAKNDLAAMQEALKRRVDGIPHDEERIAVLNMQIEELEETLRKLGAR